MNTARKLGAKSGDEYRAVTTKLLSIRDNAISIQSGASQGFVPVWVPRSLLHGADDIVTIDRAAVNDVVTVRMMAWKADELGLAG